MALAGQAIEAQAFANINAVRLVQVAEIIRCFGCCDPLQNAVGHFNQRDVQAQFGRDSGGL